MVALRATYCKRGHSPCTRVPCCFWRRGTAVKFAVLALRQAVYCALCTRGSVVRARVCVCVCGACASLCMGIPVYTRSVRFRGTVWQQDVIGSCCAASSLVRMNSPNDLGFAVASAPPPRSPPHSPRGRRTLPTPPPRATAAHHAGHVRATPVRHSWHATPTHARHTRACHTPTRARHAHAHAIPRARVTPHAHTPHAHTKCPRARATPTHARHTRTHHTRACHTHTRERATRTHDTRAQAYVRTDPRTNMSP